MAYQFAKHQGSRFVEPPVPCGWASVNEEQRQAMIAERAYLLAERRGFQGGDPLADWLQAEAEVDEYLANRLG